MGAIEGILGGGQELSIRHESSDGGPESGA